jgi:hypothetical protein
MITQKKVAENTDSFTYDYQNGETLILNYTQIK